MSSGIVFQVETHRVLQLLTKEIYDSPLALLRENVQNAYDAVRMRFACSGSLKPGGRIDIYVGPGELSITDNGVGMSETVLREHFWKAGSSGKHSADARRSGVVGTFGIGAMANFGVCTRLTVETRAEGSSDVLRSVAELASLKIAEECITLERLSEERDVGTKVTASLDEDQSISVERARRYLEPYVALLPVPVYLNGTSISGASIEAHLKVGGRSFSEVGAKAFGDGLCGGTFSVRTEPNSQVLVVANAITLGGVAVDGEMALLQNGGQLMGLRSYFGLAPIPAIGNYQFGGFANLAFLKPTAGREALSRDSIDQVTRLVGLAERAASEVIATTPAADRNNAFLLWVLSHSRYDLASRVSVRVLPDDTDVPLADIKAHVGTRTVHYYAGTDVHILGTFANEASYLVHIAQSSPRRNVQLHYVQNTLHIEQVPDSAQVTRVYRGADLTVREASVLLRIASILRDDYLIPDVEIVLADISHGVTVLPEKRGDLLRLNIARSSALLPPLLEFYDKAYDVFAHFMKDFVRIHIFQRIQQFVPSSTRDGVDALRKLLQRNRELYRYEETDRGDMEAVLGEYLSDKVDFAHVLRRARSGVRAQSQTVSRDQVGTIEAEVPDVVGSPVVAAPDSGGEFAPSPPIVRDEILSDMKLLTTNQKYPQLNHFTMLLGLSDRFMRTEADFLRGPHTTRILWGGHRVIYIFTEATGRLSLYYDIELRDPLDGTKTGGGMFPTTTLITKKRIFVPVPDGLVEEFRIAAGPKEFFVRFDTLSSDVT
jgi:molecular chaperone HtpG